jgi:hypothetical protein
MKMHILSGGRLRLRKSIYMPDADRAELIDLPVNCYLLRHPEGNVLFDTGCHPSTTTDAAGRWGSIAKAIVPISKPEDNLIDQLALVGLQPSDIDVVVNSHFHSDHCGCNEFFKKATVICHAKELEAASELDAEKMGYLAVDWKHSLPTETITEQRANIGAGINRLTYAADNLTNIASNVTASKSTVMDTDYAEASTQLSKTQIIQQAATAMLAQANQQPQSVLSLLK